MGRMLRHGNLYYIFLTDHAEHPMPEKKMLQLWQLLQNLIKGKQSHEKGESK